MTNQSFRPRQALSQLRIYTIREGKLDEFVEAWREGVLPLRRAHGFGMADDELLELIREVIAGSRSPARGTAR